MPDSPENKCPEPESQVAVHPVWGCDNEAIKDEFRRLQAERDKYLEWFQKADSELERLHFENEQRESGRSPSPDRETGSRVRKWLDDIEAEATQHYPSGDQDELIEHVVDAIRFSVRPRNEPRKPGLRLPFSTLRRRRPG